VKCSFTFQNLTDAAELDRVKAMVQSRAEGNVVEVTSGEGGTVTMSFMLPDVTAAPAVIEELKYRVSGDGSKLLVFEESARQVASTFRTVAIKGAVKVTLNFTISPGAKLFYSAAAGQEAEVAADRIGAQGNVTMDVAIARGQDFVYARTVLGEVEKCIKVDIFDSSVSTISRAEYDAHK
jgi:hypothetical protein